MFSAEYRLLCHKRYVLYSTRTVRRLLLATAPNHYCTVSYLRKDQPLFTQVWPLDKSAGLIRSFIASLKLRNICPLIAPSETLLLWRGRLRLGSGAIDTPLLRLHLAIG